MPDKIDNIEKVISVDISVVVPVYNRPAELRELLNSIINQDKLPLEVLIVDDCSQEREKIREICNSMTSLFLANKSRLRLIENDFNLGYDANLRKCLSLAAGKYAILLGNDDLLLPGAIEEVNKYLSRNNVLVASRTFIRFKNDVSKPLGISKIFEEDCIIGISKYSSKYLFRSGAFIGGLIFNVNFCKDYETTKYDGSLYYQIYLFSIAYSLNSIGYISKPIAGGRVGNIPMFGSASNEKSVHIPGSYTAKGRAKMWSGVMQIVKDVGEKYDVNLSSGVINELMIRQSFHIFEMNADSGYKANLQLAIELNNIKLLKHPIPLFFLAINTVLGKKSIFIYKSIRSLSQ